MANSIETWPQQGGDAMDRIVVLRNVMEILSVKDLAKASTAGLTSATGIGYSALHKAFGTKDDVLRAAIKSCVETEAFLPHEPLRASPTGREAILSMLEENVRLRRHWLKACGCLFTLNTFVIPTEDVDLQEFLSESSRTLLKQIRSRLAQSVSE
jgi:AcrR family transcriptional regulator